jgi:hypothetical protein
MRHLSPVLAAAGMLLAPLSSANATQILRTWVASNGLDTNTCTRAAPCLTFAGALTNTLDGGSVNCVDAGSYVDPAVGLTITKGVEIDCRNVHALAEITGATGIVINVSDPVNQSVTIRGLAINGRTGVPGTNGGRANAAGIKILAARTVALNSVLVEQFNLQGILDVRSLQASGNLNITNSSVAGNNGAGIVSAMTTNGFNSNLFMDDSFSGFNTYGIAMGNNNRARITNSRFPYNATGIETDANATINIANSVIAYSSNAAVLNSGIVAIANSELTYNSTVFSGTAAYTYNNNRIGAYTTFGTSPISQNER